MTIHTKLLLFICITAMVSVTQPQPALRAQTQENTNTGATDEQIEVLPSETAPVDEKDAADDETKKGKGLLQTEAQVKKVWSVLLAILIPAATFVLFVLILLYFFRRKLYSFLPASSKERKMIGHALKRFGIDIDKILPPHNTDDH